MAFQVHILYLAPSMNADVDFQNGDFRRRIPRLDRDIFYLPAGMFSIEPLADRDAIAWWQSTDSRWWLGAQHAWSKGVVTFYVLKTPVDRKSPGSLPRQLSTIAIDFLFTESSFIFLLLSDKRDKGNYSWILV